MTSITEKPIDLTALIQEVSHPGAGAVVLFLGLVRDHHQGRRVRRLTYEAYAAMAEGQLAGLVKEVRGRWPEVRAALLHRVGALELGEVSVAIAASSPHRGEAFEACRYLLERLKQTVPIWKREEFVEGETVWVGEGTLT